MIQIGSHRLNSKAFLAPMAGVTDLPFRQRCHQQGAALAVAEMLTADNSLWHTRKSQQRLRHCPSAGIHAIQLVGNDPAKMAESAKLHADAGAQIIDINMGCPAKKVCKQAAGSALLRNEKLVADIVSAVVNAVDVPVTLKIRTGWSPEQKNGVAIASLAENCGIQALAVHGRTRACRFKGQAEYDTIAEIVSRVAIPVIANGDVNSAEQARDVLHYTQAAGVMIGRAAQGNPWIFRQINHLLDHNEFINGPSVEELFAMTRQHIDAIHQFYGDFLGVRIARKHIGWYLVGLSEYQTQRTAINQIDNPEQQLSSLDRLYQQVRMHQEQAA